ncbi:hypothetical protein CBM2609_P180013 [Cupriavidus taiwanensis]|uniref:Uncharacterized protein n=2 Tax=Cupriavidus TaxID=106589 RepID=A0A375HYA6_9BURK|nr:hypothetical protein CBM2604_P190012 [Cupriavidus taiwanensis]SPD62329.1 protein of unknown function [Cupriavidus neocaledonicus]SOZ33873.1 hypothetical protein CBM2609_P180013 [Cupriavidus taiwanensis]SOZ50450.1 hypothetical protein CBM2610_P170012 [Cupriavidus taiwanensis]SPD61620.1 protein of unknown function [Cupriavidus taiwanensis]
MNCNMDGAESGRTCVLDAHSTILIGR